MCGRFTQFRTGEEYLQQLPGKPEWDINCDLRHFGRYNVAPGAHVMLLNERNAVLHLDPVRWGYSPLWWHKHPLINARLETAAAGRMFKPLWQTGRAIVMADGWYEWKKAGDRKHPWFIYHHSGKPVFFAAIGKVPFNDQDHHEGFVIVTTVSDKGLADIHHRRPLVLSPVAALQWMSEKTTPKQAEEIAHDGAIPAEKFRWHAVSKAVGDVKNQQADLVKKIETPVG